MTSELFLRDVEEVPEVGRSLEDTWTYELTRPDGEKQDMVACDTVERRASAEGWP